MVKVYAHVQLELKEISMECKVYVNAHTRYKSFSIGELIIVHLKEQHYNPKGVPNKLNVKKIKRC
jgi:hypothetical protein